MATKGGSVYGDSETDADGSLAEAELHRMQRQLRILEGERKSYAEEARTIMDRQSVSLDKYRRDNEFLKEELKLLKMQLSDEKKLGAGSKKADILKQQVDEFQDKIKSLTQESQSIEKQTAELDKLISKQRNALGGVLTPSYASEALKKQVIALESRLDKALGRYSKGLENNGKLREQIDVLRRERIAFDGAYKKFERELNEKKKQMSEIIEISTSAYESREEAQARMMALKEKAEKEHQNYIQELKELERQLEQDRKLREFMNIKVSERDNLKFDIKANNQAVTSGSQMLNADKIEMYEKAFSNIKEMTNSSNINELVKRFTEIENQNFSLFNYVNEINNQIETITEEIDTIESKINNYEKTSSNEEANKDVETKHLDTQLKTTQAMTEQYEKQAKTLENQTKEVVEKLKEISVILGFSIQLPATNEEIIDLIISDNGRKFLSVFKDIEQKTNENLMKNILLSLPKKFTSAAQPNPTTEKKEGANAEGDQDTSKDPAVLAAILRTMLTSGNIEEEGQNLNLTKLLGQGPAPPVKNILITPPTTGDNDDTEEEDSDEDDRPLDREELTLKSFKLIKKREQQGEKDVNDLSPVSHHKHASINKSYRRRNKKEH